MQHEPIWILDDVVLAVHRRQIAEHGGGDGVRDTALLDSALHRPKQLFHYGTPDIAALAAAYAYGIARNHPFVDGNKRTAFVACQLFLTINGKNLRAEHQEKYDIFLALAEGSVTEEQLTVWIRERLSATN